MDSTLLDPSLTADEPEAQDPKKDTPGTETIDDPDEVRLNAARKITSQGQDLRATDLAFVELLAETPEKAPGIIEKIKTDNPKLAQRLSKLLKSKDGGEKIKDPQVKAALEALSTQVETLNAKTDEQLISADRRVYGEWKKGYPQLDGRTEEGKALHAKRLRQELSKALDLVAAGVPLTDDLLEDALAIAKRRSGWQEDPTRKALDRQAAQLAARSRLPVAPKGDGVSTADAVSVDPVVGSMFYSKDPDRMKKVAEEKRKAGFR